jgi:hypothetical protein
MLRLQQRSLDATPIVDERIVHDERTPHWKRLRAFANSIVLVGRSQLCRQVEASAGQVRMDVKNFDRQTTLFAVLTPRKKSREKPRRRWGRGGVFNGRFAEEGCFLDSEPSVETKMTRRKEKWSVFDYRTSLTREITLGVARAPQLGPASPHPQ